MRGLFGKTSPGPLACPGRSAALLRCCAAAGARDQGGGTLSTSSSRGAQRQNCVAILRRCDEAIQNPPVERLWIASLRSQRRSTALLYASSMCIPDCRCTIAFSRLISPELCFISSPSLVRGCREDRMPAGHPRSTVRKLRYKRLHSGIQVKPNNRPSLRSGLTAYAEFSPGSDALLPPSPSG